MNKSSNIFSEEKKKLKENELIIKNSKQLFEELLIKINTFSNELIQSIKISQEILDKFSFIPKLAKNISKENNENLMKINNLFNIENDEKSSIYIDIKNLVLKIEKYFGILIGIEYNINEWNKLDNKLNEIDQFLSDEKIKLNLEKYQSINNEKINVEKIIKKRAISLNEHIEIKNKWKENYDKFINEFNEIILLQSNRE